MVNFHSIRTRMTFFFIILILIPTIIISVVLFNRSADTVQREVSLSLQNNLEEVANNIDYLLQNIESSSIDLILNERLIGILESRVEADPTYNDFSAQSFINSTIANKTLSSRFIDSIYLYDHNNERLYISKRGGYQRREDMEELGWYAWKDGYTGKRLWNFMPNFNFSSTSSPEKKYLITCHKNINWLGNAQRSLAGIYMNVNERTVYNFLKNLETGGPGYVFIVDEAGKIISHKDQELIDTDAGKKLPFLLESLSGTRGYFAKQVDGRQYLFTFCTSEYLGWKYIAMVPISEINAKINDIKRVTLVICMVSIILALIGGFVVSRSIYHPIKKLMISMQEAGKGNFTVSVEDNRKDEFGELNRGYNQMILQLKTLIDELYHQKLLKKDAQLRVLQSQINPHFLYNTLDSIHWIARLRKVDEIAEITFAMSRFFRLSLSQGKDIVKIADAIELAQNYLTIQRIRYRDRFQVVVDVEEGIKDYLIPKLIFQPILENAVNHGLDKKREKGEIIITGRKTGDRIEFVIKDNGVGIPEEKLKVIKASISSGDFNEEGNFALKNLSQQVKLVYGPEYGIEIESSPEEGTVVTVAISAIDHLSEGEKSV